MSLDAGGFAVVPGVLDDETVDALIGTCPVPRGGAHVMRPLLLHASSPAAAPRRRRVVHLEYAVGDLPGGLEWLPL